MLSIAADLLEPFPGRRARTIEIAVACTLVMVVSLTYRIPETALSTYLIFFVAKGNSGINIVMSVAFALLAIILALALVPVTGWTDAHPDARAFLIGGLAFLFFFLGSASKLEPVANTLGLVVGYLLYLLASVPSGELSLRLLLYVPLVVGMPMGVFVAYNIYFGRRPDRLVRRAVAARLEAVAATLRSPADPERSARELEGGNAELDVGLKMVKLLRFLPPDTRERLHGLVVLSYAALMLAATARVDREDGGSSGAMAARFEALATSVRDMPRIVGPRDAPRPAVGTSPADGDLAGLARLANDIEAVVSGGPQADLGPAPESHGHAGFFASDAFTAPRHVRHALKGTAAVLICYLTIVALQWSKIATCIVTCFIVGLPTLGEATQKLTLRITGACIGAAVGVAAIVTALPHTTSITALMALVFLGLLPAAWIAVGPPTVSYIGFQIAYAFLLCVLQGSAPAFDLTVARDRVIGILFGNVVVFLIFTRIYPVSIVVKIKDDLLVLLSQCRAAVTAASSGLSLPARASAIAAAEATIEKLATEAAAFGYEARRSRDARLQGEATRLSLGALRSLAGRIVALSTQPLPDTGSEAAADLARDCADIDVSLAGLSDRIRDDARHGHDVQPDSLPAERPASSSGPVAAVRAELDGVAAALGRYGRMLRSQGRLDG